MRRSTPDRLRLRDIDLTDLDLFADGFPHPLFEIHRRESPVWWHPPTDHTPDDEGFWSVATHAETLTVLQNPGVYSSERGGQRRYGGTALKDLEIAGVALNMMDDPRHSRIRRLVSNRLTPRSIARLEPELRRRTAHVLDTIEEGVEVDFVETAREVPLQMICMLLGIPEADRHQLWTPVDSASDIPSGDARYTPIEGRQAAKAEMYQYATGLLDEKRRHPRDDLLSVVVHAQLAETEPPTMTDAELYCFFRNMFGAGWETTSAAIAAGVLVLSDHPAQLEALRADPRRWPTAVEEVLRWSTPSPSKRRTATRRTTLRGHEIEAGDKVMVWEGSANRDSQVFDRPAEFDVGREPNPHLSFGSGVHFCLGAHLARFEMRVMYDELFKRFGAVEVTRPVEWTRGNRSTGLRHLWVRFTAAG